MLANNHLPKAMRDSILHNMNSYLNSSSTVYVEKEEEKKNGADRSSWSPHPIREVRYVSLIFFVQMQ